MLFRIFLGCFALVGVTLIATQILVPLFTQGPFFPLLRKDIREAELNKDEALAARTAANIENETRQVEHQTDTLKNKDL